MARHIDSVYREVNRLPLKEAGQNAEYSTFTYDTSALNVDKTFALCYATGDGTASDSTWFDSGIRLTVSKIYSMTMPFDLDYREATNGGCRVTSSCATADKVMTAYPAPTNTIPRFDKVYLTYAGHSVGGDVKIALVDAAVNQNSATGSAGNPCVDPSIPGNSNEKTNFAADGDTDPQTSANERMMTKAVAGSGSHQGSVANTVEIRQDPTAGTETLILGGSATAGKAAYGDYGWSYAVCYATGAGDDTDETWRDSYIRIKPSDILSFGTKAVDHYTTGQIPHHDSGLEYTYSMTPGVGMDAAADNKHFVTLVETVANYKDPAENVDATVAAADMLKVQFTADGAAGAATTTTVAAGWKIIIGTEERTIVYVDGSAQNAWVSVPFASEHTDAKFYLIDKANHATDGGFAKLPYDPCKYSGASTTGNEFSTNSDMEHIQRMQPAGSLASGTTITYGSLDIRSISVNALDSTVMKSNTPYAVCYSSNVGETDPTKNDWFDSGIRLERTALTANCQFDQLWTYACVPLDWSRLHNQHRWKCIPYPWWDVQAIWNSLCRSACNFHGHAEGHRLSQLKQELIVCSDHDQLGS